MAVRKYVTRPILENALRERRIGELPYNVQISPRVSLTFCASGVSLKKWFQKGTDYKWVNGWHEMTADAINQAFANQKWEVYC